MAGIGSNEQPREPSSPWAPFRVPLFRALWIATATSNIGTWMHDVGAAWLMTSLSPSAVMVALVQTATTLPVFLLALPAGALSDIVDRRRYLIGVQVWLALVAALLAWLVFTDAIDAWLLVVVTFAMGVGAALMLPAWAAITPEIVPRSDLQSAIALNSMGINVARAIGPALAGFLISFVGTGAVFLINALSYLGVMVVLLRWRRSRAVSTLPAERFFGALRSGYRFARNARSLHAATVRGAAFFAFASATWALLPLVARDLAGGGPQTFGVLVAAIGGGAVLGAVALPKIRENVSRDTLVALASVLYAATMITIAGVDAFALQIAAMVAAGIAWIAVLSSLQVAAQLALPDWVRSRGLAVFMTVFMGATALGSILWGRLADAYGLRVALLVAAAGLLLGIVMSWRWKIAGIETIDLTPSMHWPAPVVHRGISHDRGPVLVAIEYDVREERVDDFLATIRSLGESRKRDGASFWSVFEHTERPNRYVEIFTIESWLEHLRQHERVTDADRISQQRLADMLADGSSPLINHYVATGRA